MANLWFTLAVCAISLVTLSRADDDLKFVKAICAKNNDNLLKDLALCEDSFGSDNKQRVAKICYARVAPETGGDTFEFSKRVCKDLSLLEAGQACFEEHNQRPDEFKDLEKGSACVFTAFLKNGAMDLLGIGF
ncbi:uncharacterized protein [Parasteatoda tepidariorum]|uniref:uncharacterized protein n=1 Tax=Parasteatoda tepidariorum TaxID=114398 RepID=UPI00077FD850|nr:uncharacterized protein LOC107451430 [Parasteatoda tepidariorum]